MATEYRTSMKIAAGGGSEVSGYSRLPEVFSDEVDDALSCLCVSARRQVGLEGPGDAQEGSGLDQGGTLREHLWPEDDTPVCLAFTCLRFLPARGLASVFAYNLQRNPITTPQAPRRCASASVVLRHR